MATVKITIAPPLDCGKCDEVLLWLNNPLLLDANVGLDPADFRVFLRGKITDVTVISNGISEYTIEYDETLLTDPDGGIEAVEIKEVCCLTCLYEWIRTEALCDLLQAAPSDCFSSIPLFDLTADGGTTETLVGGDELRIFGGDSIFTLTSTPDTVTIDLVLSGDVGNILQFGTDGNLLLDCPTVLACINVQNPITGDGSPATPFGVAISADPGNDLELRVDGLYVADTQLSCADVRACIFVTNPIVGTGSGADPFGVAISADAFNVLELRIDGLYVPNVDTVLTCPQVQACITVENPIHGVGSVADPFGIDLSADIGNVLELRVDGLYVPTVDCPTVLACINVANPISGDGSGGSPFTVDISAAANNDLILNGDGLYVPEETNTTLNPSGGSPAGSRQLTYTNEIGSSREFDTGIYDLDPASTVGAGRMVTAFNLTAHPTLTDRTRLLIQSAPEIEHSAGLNAFDDVTSIPLTAIGTFFGGTKGPYVFVNPFASRRAAIIPTESINVGFRKASGNGNLNINLFYQRRYGAGAWNLVGAGLYERFTNARHADNHNFWLSFMDLTNGPLAIGGSLTISLRIGVDVYEAAAAGSAIYRHNGFMGVQYFSTN